MFVVTGASGNTGSVVAKTLLAHKLPVRVVVRDESKAAALRGLGAEVAVAAVEDPAALAAALKGATSVYLMIPPDNKSHDPIARGRRITEDFAQAVQKTGVPHVVFLSSVGAQHPTGTGIVRNLHFGEQNLGKAGAA